MARASVEAVQANWKSGWFPVQCADETLSKRMQYLVMGHQMRARVFEERGDLDRALFYQTKAYWYFSSCFSRESPSGKVTAANPYGKVIMARVDELRAKWKRKHRWFFG